MVIKEVVIFVFSTKLSPKSAFAGFRLTKFLKENQDENASNQIFA